MRTSVLADPSADPIVAVRELMIDALAQQASDKSYTNVQLANELVEALRKEDPRLLNSYLQARAVYLVTLELGVLNRADRAHRQAMVGRTAFAAAAGAFEQNGNSEPLELLMARFVVNVAGATKPAAEMGADDHRFVATQKRLTAKAAAFQAKFHLAVAEKLGNRLTKEVFTEAQYAAFYQQFAKPAEEASQTA